METLIVVWLSREHFFSAGSQRQRTKLAWLLCAFLFYVFDFDLNSRLRNPSYCKRNLRSRALQSFPFSYVMHKKDVIAVVSFSKWKFFTLKFSKNSFFHLSNECKCTRKRTKNHCRYVASAERSSNEINMCGNADTEITKE